MQKTDWEASFLWVTLSLIILSGCGGPNVANLVTVPEFTHQSIQNRLLIVGGVTSAVGKAEVDIMTQSSAVLLREQLIEQIEGINVAPLNLVSATLGESNYHAMLQNFNNTGTLSANDLNTLAAIPSASKAYLILSRLESDTYDNTNGQNSDSTGVILNYYYLARRKLVASFKIWDLATQKMVWSGQIDGKATATNSYDQEPPPPEEEDSGLLVEVVEEILGLNDEPEEEEQVFEYPETPSFTWVARTVFGKFAKALPQE